MGNKNILSLFPPAVIRLGIIISVVLVATIFFVTNTAAKANSESDVKFKQESIFKGAGLGAKQNIATDSEVEEKNTVSFTFEVDKVTPTPTPAVDPGSNDIWYKLADCESHINWQDDTGNGYYGGLQFSLGAWASVGGTGKPSDASAEEQIEKGKLLQQRRGWGPWGACSKRLGLL